MKFLGATVSVVVGVSVASGCAGKLEVGDEPQAETTGETGSDSTNGGTSGAGGTMPGTTAAGGGGSGGSSSDAGNGDTCWLDEFEPVAALPSSSEGCPMGPICPEAACETEGLTCRYFYESAPESASLEECYCIRTWNDHQIWSCYHGSTSADDCPREAPEHGSDCYGYFGVGCYYPPGLECSCSDSSETWDCPRPEPREVPDPPETLDPERLVGELSDEERATWCEWYSTIKWKGPGYPLVDDRPVENGYATGPACLMSFEFCQAAVPTVSKAQCMANLSLSECEAPLKHLTGCAVDMYRDCGPFDYNCLDYLESPHCEGTIVHRADSLNSDPSCDLRVE